MIQEKTICKYCGKEFQPHYELPYWKKIKYCSKSCAVADYRNMQRPNFYSKKDLERHIKNIIIQLNRYVSQSEIIEYLHISSKTLNKYKVSILMLNRECGFKKPHSLFEHFVGIYLEEIFDDLEYEKTFSNCLSPRGYNLRFDFYSDKHHILVEADGDQHYNKKNNYYNEYVHQCDLIKNRYAYDNNYILIRIPYTKKVTREYVEQYVKNSLLDPLTKAE